MAGSVTATASAWPCVGKARAGRDAAAATGPVATA
eukprot:CAMPEP_0179967154 /NCGR_PEP_ID=MMETSP0983-20121128/32968_1 /TAXON_ID=483367 /ORGANISM="non described non described, Strain CCMP 2436" /LENGTH=34 /DNA_ID= /DNA_START= /DNA_END= /DNA_ORIENTATION=